VLETEALFKPFELKKGVTLDNRFVLSPMVTNSSTKEGHITEDDLKYAERRALAAALQITGAAYVNKHGQLFEYGFSATSLDDIEGLTKLAKAMKSGGAKAILQLTHAGRFASHALNRDRYVYGPSAMTLQSPFPHEVKELTVEEIHGIIEDYRRAAQIAIQSGFDGLEISSAQRLLIQTFFSTFSNERTDEYGCKYFQNILFGYADGESHVKVREGTKSISGEAFLNSDRLEKIDIPKSVEMIGMEAFSGCKNLKECIFEEESNIKIIYK